MAEQLWAGIDVGKEHHWIAVVDAAGKVLLSRKVANDERQIVAAIADTCVLAGRVSWTVDLTTVEAALLLSVLWANDQQVRYLSGRSVHQASKVYRGESKTDARDARVIADQSRMRADLPILQPDSDLIAELRMLTARRADLVADRTRTINRLRQQLTAVCPALERAADITGPRGWVLLLARYQRPKAIRRAGVDRLTRVLTDAGVRNPDKIVEAAVAAARSQTVRLPGEEVAADLVAALAQEVIDLDTRIKQADTAIEERFRRHHLADVIVSMPGFGFRLGAELLAAIGDLNLIAVICLARRRTNVLWALMRDNRTWQPEPVRA